MKGQNIKKISKQKNSTCSLKMIRKQEIILFLWHTTKCPKEAEKVDCAKRSYYRLWKTN